jgi:DNA-binding GntR family transcriptional regulator
MLNQLTRLLQSFRELGFKDREVRETTYQEHLQLIDAIYKRDVPVAKEVLENHIRGSKIRILRTVYHREK